MICWSTLVAAAAVAMQLPVDNQHLHDDNLQILLEVFSLAHEISDANALYVYTCHATVQLFRQIAACTTTF